MFVIKPLSWALKVGDAKFTPAMNAAVAAVAVAMRQKASGFIGCLELY